MNAKELQGKIPYLDGEKFEVVIATENDKYGMGRNIKTVLEDKEHKTIILVAEEFEKPNFTGGATGNE